MSQASPESKVVRVSSSFNMDAEADDAEEYVDSENKDELDFLVQEIGVAPRLVVNSVARVVETDDLS